MSSQRRTPRGGPGGSTRPGTRTSRTDRGTPRARSAASRHPAPDAGVSAAGARVPANKRPSRITGRAAVLVLVVAVLAVSYASSMRAYLQQRENIGEQKAAIAERENAINALEREKQRWQDPSYVKAQARARFGYLMPGQTGFLVLDKDGNPLESQATLTDPADVIKTVPTAWWSDAWSSVELAGNPPPPPEAPAAEIDGVK